MKPKKKNGDNLYERLAHVESLINSILEEIKPNTVVVEDYSLAFGRGRSNIKTIILLAMINELVCLQCYKRKIPVKKYAVTSIRKTIADHYNQPSLSSKDDIFEFIVNRSAESKKLYKVRYTSNNNVQQECYDEVDAIAVCLKYCIDQKKFLIFF